MTRFQKNGSPSQATTGFDMHLMSAPATSYHFNARSVMSRVPRHQTSSCFLLLSLLFVSGTRTFVAGSEETTQRTLRAPLLGDAVVEARLEVDRVSVSSNSAASLASSSLGAVLLTEEELLEEKVVVVAGREEGGRRRLCGRGQHREHGQCRECPNGKYQDQETSYIYQSSCKTCLAGTYQDQAGKNYCLPCTAGRYSDEIAATTEDQCQYCGKGKFTTQPSGVAIFHFPVTIGDSPNANTLTKTLVPSSISEIPAALQSSFTKVACPSLVNKSNWLNSGTTSNEAFRITVSDLEVTARRIDGNGVNAWNLALQFTCTTNNHCEGLCPIGTYSDIEGLNHVNSCKNCPSGNTTLRNGSTAESACVYPQGRPLSAPSSSDDMTATGCTVCGYSLYSDEFVTKPMIPCKSCPHGRYIANDKILPEEHDGVDKCIPCVAGKWYENSTKTCQVCPIGRYRDKASTTVKYGLCKECSVGKYNGFDAQATRDKHDEEADCVDCPVGQITDGKIGLGFCSPCAAGRHLITETKRCRDCPAGWKQEIAGQTSCNTCIEGYYQKDGGQPFCFPCNPGKYNDQENQAECKPCVEGKYRGPDDKADKCLDCAIGDYSTAGSQICLGCDLGKFGATPGECDDCPIGKYNDLRGSTACSPCAAGKAPSELKTGCERPAWKLPEDCEPKEQYLNDQSDDKEKWTCESCPPGAECWSSDDGNRRWNQVVSLPGYHRLTFDSHSFGSCPFPAACNLNLSFAGGCALGHDPNASELCSQCLGATPEAPNGYAAQSRGEACEPCPSTEDTGRLFSGAIMLAVLLFSFLVWDNLDGANDMIPKDEEHIEDVITGDSTTTTKMPFHSIVIRIVSSYLQIAGMLLQFDLHLPPSVRTLVVVEASASSLRYVFFTIFYWISTSFLSETLLLK